ncbi:amino acid deaminase/aldolase [Actinocatenispora rupis]|uniref:Alanine racemase n=1 Tax=Actinocatenispora rupis TaxID=519421 RepID=A0A8J3J819_9ACTN|nr:alanine racemase [Actinocatenispora rupis]
MQAPRAAGEPAPQLRARLDAATADLDPPFAVVDLAAFRANAAALRARAAGRPIRVASKSVRCRTLIDKALTEPGYAGVMAFTLAEAAWLARTHPDVLCAYPSADRGAIGALRDPELAARVTVLVDSADQLDLIDAVLPADRPPVRVCLELDASWRPLGLHLGVRRSPLHTPAQLATAARAVVARPGFRLVGLMAYEAQIAGLQDRPAGRPLYGAAIRLMQRYSAAELRDRRAAAVAAVRAVTELEFVNGGGTGSVHSTAAEAAVTEVAAGSGLYGPATFDGYSAWRPRPAAWFALPVVRRPARGVVTVAGGGWVASGVPGRDRLPRPTLPVGLRLLGSEGAGEVQTPLAGPAADHLDVGDRVWFRHAKAGELADHVTELHLVDGDRVVDTVPTYRGEGKAFL